MSPVSHSNMAFEFVSMRVIEKRSQAGYLAKTKTGKVFLLQSSRGGNSTKKNKNISRDDGEQEVTGNNFKKVIFLHDNMVHTFKPISL